MVTPLDLPFHLHHQFRPLRRFNRRDYDYYAGLGPKPRVAPRITLTAPCPFACVILAPPRSPTCAHAASTSNQFIAALPRPHHRLPPQATAISA